ncbi:MAG: TIGR04255 family protein [Methanosarcinales archaeon]|nr:MAG: TIGR04255 family protein [Methanosarcinales archaeon]
MDSPIKSQISSAAFPSYRKPPVNEVVCGMRFHTPDKLRIPHIGLLWNKFRADYPKVQHAPPIASVKGELQIDQETGMPIPRVWFINESDDQLVQFQIDRFYYNWRRKQGDYPRYTHVIKQFESVLNTIDIFLKEHDLGGLDPIEYELSYINHIPKGEGWDAIDDLPRVFSDFVWAQKKERFLPNPANVAWKTEFPLPGKMGRLAITLNQAIRTYDKVPLIVLELNARGLDESADKKDYRKWFNVAHEWIVRGFTDITTAEVHKIWERE